MPKSGTVRSAVIAMTYCIIGGLSIFSFRAKSSYVILLAAVFLGPSIVAALIGTAISAKVFEQTFKKSLSASVPLRTIFAGSLIGIGSGFIVVLCWSNTYLLLLPAAYFVSSDQNTLSDLSFRAMQILLILGVGTIWGAVYGYLSHVFSPRPSAVMPTADMPLPELRNTAARICSRVLLCGAAYSASVSIYAALCNALALAHNSP